MCDTLDDIVLSGVRTSSLTGGFNTEVELIEPEPRMVVAGRWWGNGGFWPKGTLGSQSWGSRVQHGVRERR